MKRYKQFTTMTYTVVSIQYDNEYYIPYSYRVSKYIIDVCSVLLLIVE